MCQRNLVQFHDWYTKRLKGLHEENTLLGGCFNYVSITVFPMLTHVDRTSKRFSIWNFKKELKPPVYKLDIFFIYRFSVNLSCRVMFDLKAHTVPNLPHSPRAQLMLDACSVLEAHGELHIVFWQMAEIHPDLDGASRELKGWGYSLMKGRNSTTRIMAS